jgi:hypothetical protein
VAPPAASSVEAGGWTRGGGPWWFLTVVVGVVARDDAIARVGGDVVAHCRPLTPVVTRRGVGLSDDACLGKGARRFSFWHGAGWSCLLRSSFASVWCSASEMGSMGSPPTIMLVLGVY